MGIICKNGISYGGGGGAGGHVIEDESGNAMTARANLQFKGCDVSDDGTNSRTVVDMSFEEITYADWLELTDEEKESGRYDITGVPGADGTISIDLMTKLWENPDPTSIMTSGTTFTLSSSDYDYLLTIVKIKNDTAICGATISPKNSGISLTLAIEGRVASRSALFTSATLGTFYSGFYNGAQNNEYAIPLAVYGIKTTTSVKINAIAMDVSTSADKCMLSDGVTNVEDAIEALNVWTTPVNCVIGDTTATIVDENILTTSIIEDYSQNSSGTRINVSEITVTTGQAVLHFDALEEATSFRLHVVNV